MKRAFSQTYRRPEEVDFLELHATGEKIHIIMVSIAR